MLNDFSIYVHMYTNCGPHPSNSYFDLNKLTSTQPKDASIHVYVTFLANLFLKRR